MFQNAFIWNAISNIYVGRDAPVWQQCSENVSLEFTIKLQYKVIDIYLSIFFSRKNNDENINTWPFPYHLGYQSLAIISPRLRLDMEKVM
jgi:hypothetical protein